MSEDKAKKEHSKGTGPESIELRPGPRKRHGGYTYIRTGKMPKKRAAVERYLTWVRQTYIEDIAGTEENMTAGQIVLLNKLVLLEGLCRCIETTTAEVTERTGALYNMPTKYLSYVNQIVKICGMLGIERKEITRDVSPVEQAKIIKAELADKEEDNG